MDNKKVLFLLSTERSGSTFFIHLLNAHSRIFAPPTSHLIRILYNNIHRYGNLKNNQEILFDDVKAVLKNMLGKWNTDVDELQFNIKNWDSNEVIKQLIEQVYFPFAQEKSHILIKENYSWQFYAFLKDVLGVDKFIHLVRDPRDVALSWKKSPNHPGGVKEAVSRWKEDQEEFIKLKDENYFLVKYEELISNAEVQLNTLFVKIGVPFEKDILNFYKNKTAQANAVRLQNWNNISQPILTNNKGKFKDELTADEVAYIEFHCKKLMDLLGYTTHSDLCFDESKIITPNTKEEKLTPDEKAIRENRLAVIQQIISRDLS